MSLVGMTTKMLAHSIGPAGVPLISVECRFPKFLLAQITTYGTLSVSARSSRAIPTEKLIAEVEAEPYMPSEWRERVKGMKAGDSLPSHEQEYASRYWGSAVASAVRAAKEMASLSVSKEHVNRLLEPFSCTHAVITGTLDRWEWVFHQRISDDAQPEFRELATQIKKAIEISNPRHLNVGDWHAPYTADAYVGKVWSDREERLKISAARVARVSYKPHDAENEDENKDSELAERLASSGHLEPFAHVAMACRFAQPYGGRHTGWLSYRTMMGY